ncbi:MAG TPA: DUF5666 domain-containing protein [Terracidiphilus sp.]|nr:DUF5666 domain-containing protein [Terracidiphilus sp.]
MRLRLLSIMLLGLAVCAAGAQDASGPPQGQWGGGQRGGRGGGMWGAGRGTVGTVTAIAPDHFTIKTELGETYTVHFSVNTRILKQPAGPRRPRGEDGERTPPQAIKASDITVGDAIMAAGEVDADAKSVGAVMILLIDPERAKEMRAMEANYGKTWLMGRVAAINEVRVTLEGGPDKAKHDFVADENTTFRERREPITLADIKVGDMVRVEGAVKDGTFVAATVAVMGPPPGGPRGQNGDAPPPAPPQ